MRLPRQRSCDAHRGGLADLLRLIGLDVLDAVRNTAADLDELRALARVPPPLQRAGRYRPASSEFGLVQMPRSHSGLRRFVSNRGDIIRDAVGETRGEGRVKPGVKTCTQQKSRPEAAMTRERLTVPGLHVSQ